MISLFYSVIIDHDRIITFLKILFWTHSLFLCCWLFLFCTIWRKLVYTNLVIFLRTIIASHHPFFYLFSVNRMFKKNDKLLTNFVDILTFFTAWIFKAFSRFYKFLRLSFFLLVFATWTFLDLEFFLEAFPGFLSDSYYILDCHTNFL